MANLDAASDKAVHDAVDAYMEGRLTPEFSGETVFETKNSRYRLLDGVVFAAPDDSLVGAELVGWLMETTRRSVVGSAWQPGSRAVLVDRHRGRNIIVTSTTRLLHLEEHVSSDAPTMRPPAPTAPDPFFSPQRARIVAATPLPPAAVPGRTHSPEPPGPPAPSPVQSAALLQKRAAAVHLPPRLIVPSTPLPIPRPVVPVRPLPLPAPPPRRDAPTLPQVNLPQQPPAATAWELTSSEFEIDPDFTEPGPTDDVPTRLDAPRYTELDPSDPPTDEALSGAESSTDAPIPLTRPIDPGSPRRR